eukprot:EC799618.1.p1 GENE.EC799618.1~~EC799618.1.p1  ORF type:complete len:230 (+),score=76.90 EC799618.1:56-745(+)
MRLRAGMHGAQGWRPTMEDEEICELELNRAFNLSGFPEPHAFFAVLDGHCGNMTSRYARDHLAKNVASHPFFGIDARQAFISGFQKTDEELRAVEETESGSTCCSVLIRGDEVFCANLGDSRAVLCEDGSAVALSVDHKPDDSSEKRRIEDLGGFVEMGRVNGILAVSRAFGDGLWDVMSNSEAVGRVSDKLKEGLELNDIAEWLCKEAIKMGSTDNVSAIIIVLDHSA